MSIFSRLWISFLSAKKQKVVFTMHSTPSCTSGKKKKVLMPKRWILWLLKFFLVSFQYDIFYRKYVVQEIYIIRVPMYLGLPMAWYGVCVHLTVSGVLCDAVRVTRYIWYVHACLPSTSYLCKIANLTGFPNHRSMELILSRWTKILISESRSACVSHIATWWSNHKVRKYRWYFPETIWTHRDLCIKF